MARKGIVFGLPLKPQVPIFQRGSYFLVMGGVSGVEVYPMRTPRAGGYDRILSINWRGTVRQTSVQPGPSVNWNFFNEWTVRFVSDFCQTLTKHVMSIA